MNAQTKTENKLVWLVVVAVAAIIGHIVIVNAIAAFSDVIEKLPF